MGKKHSRPAPPPTQNASPEWSGWKWIVVLILSVGVGYGATLGYSKVRRWLHAPAADAPPSNADAPLSPMPRPESPAPEGMVWIPGGSIRIGTSEEHPHFRDAPEHDVEVGGFWMDETEVTNAQFAAFVEATKYVTVAEQKPGLESIRAGLPAGAPDPPPEVLVPGSLVFVPPDAPPLDPEDVRTRFRWTPGACWKHPEGPGSDIKDRMNHPVVHVCWRDAAAYAQWAGKRLPTEAEWEFAARGGLAGKKYAWGDEDPGADGKWRCNIWQGEFPWKNTLKDGSLRTSPVRTFNANGYGLYDVAGNVWEWCGDWYRPDAYLTNSRRNPTGPDSSYDPMEANPFLPKRVQRGGSFLCSDGVCSRYKPYGRGKGAIDEGLSHVGFRCVKDAK